MRRALAVVVVAAVCALATGAAPRDAAACENGVQIEVDPRIGQVASASAALDADNPNEAVRRVLRVFPRLRTATLGPDGVQSRAMRVMALATTRLDGAVSAAPDWHAATAEDREASYIWAIRVLRGLAMRRATDPATLTDLGEALSRRVPTREESRKILELLATRDLITNAYGWAALARVRLAAGDTDGRATAVARCAKMTKTIGVCKVRGEPPVAGG